MTASPTLLPFSSMSMASTNSLPAYVLKQLLCDIEQKNLPFHNISLTSICNNRIDIYGPRGDKTRRQVQKVFDKLKRSSVKKYHAKLLRNNVMPGSATLAKLNNEKQEEEDELDEEDFTLVDDTDSLEPETLPTSVRVQQFPPRSISKMQDDQPPIWTPPRVQSPFLSPPQMASFHGSSATTEHRGSTTDQHHQPSPFLSPLSQPMTRPGSSKKNPIVLLVDELYPEANTPFQIHCISDLQVPDRDTIQKGFYIAKEVNPNNVNLYEAYVTVPEESGLTGLSGHSLLMIKAPSLSHPFRNPNSLSSNPKEILQAQKHTSNTINTTEERQTTYWLLVFPKRVSLDNMVFSNHERNTTKRVNMAHESGIVTTDIFWCMAVKGSAKDIGDTAKKFDLAAELAKLAANP